MTHNGNYLIQGTAFTQGDITYIDDGTGSIAAYGCKNCEGYGTFAVKKQYEVYTARLKSSIKRVQYTIPILKKRYSILGDAVLTKTGWKSPVRNLNNDSTSIMLVDNEWIAINN